MTSFAQITAKWEQAPSWKVCLCCVSNAERTYPVIGALASEESSKLCRDALDAAWGPLLQPAPGVLKHHLHNVEELPESAEDDSRKPAYLVMRAISILAYALEAEIGERPPVQTLKYSLSALLQLAADVGADAFEERERKHVDWVYQEMEGAAELSPDLVGRIRQWSAEMGAAYADACRNR